jgi:hypothetical protein
MARPPVAAAMAVGRADLATLRLLVPRERFDEHGALDI